MDTTSKLRKQIGFLIDLVEVCLFCFVLNKNNATHGIIEATVDIKNGPRPNGTLVFYAQTIDERQARIGFRKKYIF